MSKHDDTSPGERAFLAMLLLWFVLAGVALVLVVLWHVAGRLNDFQRTGVLGPQPEISVTYEAPSDADNL